MPSQHAIISPSSAKRRIICPGSARMEKGKPDTAGEDAALGTAAHALGEMCLTEGRDALAYKGRRIAVGPRTFEVDETMAGYVQTYVDTVRQYQGDGDLHVEVEVPIGFITGEEGAAGTSDAIIVRGNELIVIDLKYGANPNNPERAEKNEQLSMYALGALALFDLAGDIERVRLVIIQPRRADAPSEWDCSVHELREWARITAAPRLRFAYQLYQMEHEVDCHDFLQPDNDACRYCKAKVNCPKLNEFVQSSVGAEFTDLTTQDKVEQEAIVKKLVPHGVEATALGAKMDAVELVEIWCKAIRGAVEGELLNGRPVAGYKLVQGRKGARAWCDAAEVEKALKSMRLKKEEMYDFRLISPTTAETLLKPTPKRWAKVQTLITQSEGKPSVAHVSDKRPPLEIKPLVDEFSVIEPELA